MMTAPWTGEPVQGAVLAGARRSQFHRHLGRLQHHARMALGQPCRHILDHGAQGGIGAVMQGDAMRLVFDQDRGMGCHRVRSRLVQRGQVQIDLMGGFDQMARQ